MHQSLTAVNVIVSNCIYNTIYMVTITPEKECKDIFTEFVVWRYGLEFLFQTKMEYGKGTCNMKSEK